MKRFIPVAVIVGLFATQAFCEQWIEITRNEKGTVFYADKDSVGLETERPSIMLWAKEKDGTETVWQDEYDCRSKKVRTIYAFQIINERFSGGKQNGPMQGIKSGSVGEAIWTKLCTLKVLHDKMEIQ